MIPIINPYLLPRYSLENERGIASERYEMIKGVYFIFLKDDILYVGKSNNIQSRIREHYRKDWYLKEMKIAHIEEQDISGILLKFRVLLSVFKDIKSIS